MMRAASTGESRLWRAKLNGLNVWWMDMYLARKDSLPYALRWITLTRLTGSGKEGSNKGQWAPHTEKDQVFARVWQVRRRRKLQARITSRYATRLGRGNFFFFWGRAWYPQSSATTLSVLSNPGMAVNVKGFAQIRIGAFISEAQAQSDPCFSSRIRHGMRREGLWNGVCTERSEGSLHTVC